MNTGASTRTRLYDGWEWIGRRCEAGDNSVFSPEMCLRKSVQKETGHYDLRTRQTSDLNMWLRAASRCRVAYLEGTIQAYYREHASSMSHTEHAATTDQLEQRRLASTTFFSTVPATATFSKWAKVANRRIALDSLYEASRGVERGELRTHADVEPFLAVAQTSCALSCLGGSTKGS